MSKPKRGPGRLPTYSKGTRDYICEQMSHGRTLNKICAEPGMPSKGTVMEWVLKDDGGFAAQYARARALMLEHWAEEVADVADDCGTDNAEVAKARLRVDSRKWLLSKLRPEQYGDRVALTDPDGTTLKIKMVA